MPQSNILLFGTKHPVASYTLGQTFCCLTLQGKYRFKLSDLVQIVWSHFFGPPQLCFSNLIINTWAPSAEEETVVICVRLPFLTFQPFLSLVHTFHHACPVLDCLQAKGPYSSLASFLCYKGLRESVQLYPTHL